VSDKGKSITNYEKYEYESFIAKTLNCSIPSIFVLCEKCYWCATYLDKTRIPMDNKCPECNSTDQLSSLVIMSNESFIFNYNDIRGVELKFNKR
jgi:predicted Zn-ribbon and HTH transcriptional regulator